jgi:hypothetical protein
MPTTAAVVPMPTTAVLLPAESPAPTLSKPPQEHELEVPIQVGSQIFVIHRVLGGESFEQLTKQYDTSPDAIRALNRGLTGALWADAVIVIAPGRKLADHSLPILETYQVQDPSITIDELAALLGSSPASLRAYNGCEDNCRLLQDDWIIVPRPE